MSPRKKKRNIPEETLKVAVVAEPLFKHGGAEVHLRYIIKAFPNCEVYTAYYDKKFVKEFFGDIKIHHSFMQYLPKKFEFRQLYLLFQPLAYRSFKLKGYEVIVSLSIAFAKFAHAKGVKHIDLCMTPPKFFWEKEGRSIKNANQFKGLNKFLFKFYSFFMDTFLEKLWQKWDKQAAQKCDKIAAISKIVKKRIKKYYELEADVLYPPVEVKRIQSYKKMNRKENWFLYMGRVETYKGVDLAIKACAMADVPLKIGGTGDHLEQMQELVKDMNAKGLIKFLGYISDDEKINLLSRCRALIFPVRNEDFGMIPVEANAAGTPVIAYREGGVLETISEDNPKTGVFFDKYDVETLAETLKNFKDSSYDPDNCRKQADNFAAEIFMYKLRNYVKE
ncbi:MAG TPA: glycosyltransferase [Candidatus Dojkabacteria bacterium]|nr:glycosyltransferase [Candidatus Dojkabacteria bacterium]